MTQTPALVNDMFPGALAVPFDFYVWVPATAESALRTSKKLFSSTADAQVAQRLSSLPTLSYADASGTSFGAALRDEFQSGLLAWPQPWATRMLQSAPKATLVHVSLRSDAWLAVIGSYNLTVYDRTRSLVPTTEVNAHPERVGAIYFDDTTVGCLPVAVGGQVPSRGFIVGNEAELQEWSLGSAEILGKMQSDLKVLTQFFNATRSCPISQDQANWSQSVSCNWQEEASSAPRVPLDSSEGGAAGADEEGPGGAAPQASGSGGASGVGGASSGFGGGFSSATSQFQNGTEQFAYEGCLVAPNADYFPAPAQIAAIIDTLQGDLFESNPLVVTPGSP